MAEKAVLLVNLGSPDSPEPKDVKRYLGEFLMDERVIDVPKWLRTFLVKGIILNTRPKKSAKAYQSIWTKEGSPLIVWSYKLMEKLQSKLNAPIALGMRYGNPSIASAIESLHAENPDLKEIFLVPLYPHYAMSSYETVVVKAREVIETKFPHIKMRVKKAFYKEPAYINALANSIEPYLHQDYDHLLFSYHGIPERHIKKGDITKSHCLNFENCCDLDSPSHEFCYRHQAFETTKLVAEKLKLDSAKFSNSFQSRLGGDPWLQPFTDKTIESFAKDGMKKLLIVCPAFVSDCLETIEEIGDEAKEIFEENGGEHFELIPCLNDNEQWISVLEGWSHKFLK